jgi:hypothetical protein
MFVPGVNGSIIANSNAPTGSRLKGAYKNSKKRKMPNGGLTSLTAKEETEFQKFYKTLPSNLQSDTSQYDIRGYWDSLKRPIGFDYSQRKEDDGLYHAYSRHPQTGKMLKAMDHPTASMAIKGDKAAGYSHAIDPSGNVYSFSPSDLPTAGPFKVQQNTPTYPFTRMDNGGWSGWTPTVAKPYMRTSPAGNAGYSDNTKVSTPDLANRKAAEAAQYARKVGSVTQGKVKSDYEKAREASSFVSQAEQRKGSADPLNYVLDMVNPVSLAFAATDLVGNTGSAVSNVAQGNFKEAGSNLLNAGINALQVIPAASELRGPLKSAGKYLTTNTPLKNTYKYNPLAFKPNETNWYRQVGKSAIDDVNQTKLLREAGEEVSPRMHQEFENQLVRMQGSGLESKIASRRPNSPFFAKGELFYPMGRKPTITSSGKISKNPAGKGDADYLIESSLPNESFQPAYVKGMSLGVPTEVGQTAILKPNPSLRTIDNFNFYKKDWLQGYKQIKKPGLKEGGEIDHDDDKDMVNGVASILRRVESKSNRLKLANQLSKQFNREKVKYDLTSFLAKSKVKK